MDHSIKMDTFLFQNDFGSITDTTIFRQSTAILNETYSIDTSIFESNENTISHSSLFALTAPTSMLNCERMNLSVTDSTLTSLPYTRNSLNVMSNTMDYLVNLLDNRNNSTCEHTNCNSEETTNDDISYEHFLKDRTDSLMSANTENILFDISDTMDNLSLLLGTMSNIMNNKTDNSDNLVALDDIKNDLDTLTCTMNDLVKISEKKMLRYPAAQLDLENLENVSNNSDDDYYLISPTRLDLITIPDTNEELCLFGDTDSQLDAENDLIKLSASNDDLISFETCGTNLANNISAINLINL